MLRTLLDLLERILYFPYDMYTTYRNRSATPMASIYLKDSILYVMPLTGSLGSWKIVELSVKKGRVFQISFTQMKQLTLNLFMTDELHKVKAVGIWWGDKFLGTYKFNKVIAIAPDGGVPLAEWRTVPEILNPALMSPKTCKIKLIKD